MIETQGQDIKIYIRVILVGKTNGRNADSRIQGQQSRKKNTERQGRTKGTEDGKSEEQRDLRTENEKTKRQADRDKER
jgi:hypothetical protein